MENHNQILEIVALKMSVGCLRDLVDILIYESELLDRIMGWSSDFRIVCINRATETLWVDEMAWIEYTVLRNSNTWWMDKGGVAHRRNCQKKGREIGNRESVISWYQRKGIFQMKEDTNNDKCYRE